MSFLSGGEDGIDASLYYLEEFKRFREGVEGYFCEITFVSFSRNIEYYEADDHIAKYNRVMFSVTLHLD